MDRYERVCVRDGYRCIYCGQFLLADFDSWASLHTDHLVPKSADGDESEENLVTSCPTCNSLKGAFRPGMKLTRASREPFIQAIRKYIAERRTEDMQEFLEAVSDWQQSFNPKRI